MPTIDRGCWFSSGGRWKISLELMGFFSQHVHVTYPYSSVMTFGGCRDDFMLVIRSILDQSSGKGHTEKLLFRMAAPKVGLTAAKTCYSHLPSMMRWAYS